MARDDEPRSTGQEIQEPKADAVARGLEVRSPASPDRLNRQSVDQVADAMQGGWVAAEQKIDQFTVESFSGDPRDFSKTIFPRDQDVLIRPIGWQFSVDLREAASGFLSWSVVDGPRGSNVDVDRLRIRIGGDQTGVVNSIVADTAQLQGGFQFSGTGLFKPVLPGLDTDLAIGSSNLQTAGGGEANGTVTATVIWIEVPDGVQLPK